MATMSIRGLDENILRELKARAKREGIGLNSLALRLLKEGDLSQKKRRKAGLTIRATLQGQGTGRRNLDGTLRPFQK